VHITRAFLYGFVCGENDGTMTCDKFLAGCSRFGLDSPCPTICKRLHCYGNAEEIDRDFKRILRSYHLKHPSCPDFKEMDPDVHQPVNFRQEEEVVGQEDQKDNQVESASKFFVDTQKTKPLEKKYSAFLNLNYLPQAPHLRSLAAGQEMSNEQQLGSNAATPSQQDVRIVGININLQDIKNSMHAE
jgi:hypothetical protein